MIERFVSWAWIGGQAFYWFFLRHQTHACGALYWDALQLRLGKKLLKEE